MTTPVVVEPWVLSGALREFAADGENDLLLEIIELFLIDTENRVESLRQAVSASDFPVMQRIGHGLKGAARQMGLESLADQAEHVERKCAESDSTDLHPRVLELSESWGQWKHAVIATRDSLKST